MFVTSLSYVVKEDRVRVFQPVVVSDALSHTGPALFWNRLPTLLSSNSAHMQVCTYFCESCHCVLGRLDSEGPDEGDNCQSSVIQPANVGRWTFICTGHEWAVLKLDNVNLDMMDGMRRIGLHVWTSAQLINT